MKLVVIHQPDFAPYLGFFHRLLKADLFVVLDHVQFVHSNNSWTHRDKIKTAQGERWLTVSVKKAPRDTAINEIELSTTVDWRAANIGLLEAAYRRTPYFKEIIAEVKELYGMPATRLYPFNMNWIRWLLGVLDIDVPIVESSTLSPEGQKNDLLVDILMKVKATHYLSGVGARGYFDPDPFVAAGIEVVWQEFSHPVYPQQHGDFIPYLSTLDVLFNCGKERTREILRSV